MAVRDVAKARRFADRGVGVRHGVDAEPATLPGAVDGADQLLVGERVPPGIELDLAAGRRGYCPAAGPRGGTRWLRYDGVHGGLQTTAFSSAADAIETHVSGAHSSGWSSAT